MIFALLACISFWVASAAALHDSATSFYLAISAGMFCALHVLIEARALLAGTSDDPKAR